MSRTNLKMIITLLLAVLISISCGSDEEKTPEVKAVNGAITGRTTDLYINNGQTYKSYLWVVTDAAGEEVTCTDTDKATAKCDFEIGGRVTATVTVETESGEKLVIKTEFEVLDYDLPKNQPPAVKAVISADGATIATVSSLLSKDKGEAVFTVNKEVKFNFSGTTDDQTPKEELKYQIEFEKDAGFQDVEKVQSHTFTTVGKQLVTVRAIDADGNFGDKTFDAIIICDADVNYLAIDPAKVSITPGEFRNFFTYDASTATSGGDPANYEYRWDYNGDGIYDTDWIQQASIEEYTIFAGDRDVRVKIHDKYCDFTKEATIKYNFVIEPRSSFRTISPLRLRIFMHFTFITFPIKTVSNSIIFCFLRQKYY